MINRNFDDPNSTHRNAINLDQKGHARHRKRSNSRDSSLSRYNRDKPSDNFIPREHAEDVRVIRPDKGRFKSQLVVDEVLGNGRLSSHERSCKNFWSTTCSERPSPPSSHPRHVPTVAADDRGKFIPHETVIQSNQKPAGTPLMNGFTKSRIELETSFIEYHVLRARFELGLPIESAIPTLPPNTIQRETIAAPVDILMNHAKQPNITVLADSMNVDSSYIPPPPSAPASTSNRLVPNQESKRKSRPSPPPLPPVTKVGHTGLNYNVNVAHSNKLHPSPPLPPPPDKGYPSINSASLFRSHPPPPPPPPPDSEPPTKKSKPSSKTVHHDIHKPITSQERNSNQQQALPPLSTQRGRNPAESVVRKASDGGGRAVANNQSQSNSYSQGNTAESYSRSYDQTYSHSSSDSYYQSQLKVHPPPVDRGYGNSTERGYAPPPPTDRPYTQQPPSNHLYQYPKDSWSNGSYHDAPPPVKYRSDEYDSGNYYYNPSLPSDQRRQQNPPWRRKR